MTQLTSLCFGLIVLKQGDHGPRLTVVQAPSRSPQGSPQGHLGRRHPWGCEHGGLSWGTPQPLGEASYISNLSGALSLPTCPRHYVCPRPSNKVYLLARRLSWASSHQPHGSLDEQRSSPSSRSHLLPPGLPHGALRAEEVTRVLQASGDSHGSRPPTTACAALAGLHLSLLTGIYVP